MVTLLDQKLSAVANKLPKKQLATVGFTELILYLGALRTLEQFQDCLEAAGVPEAIKAAWLTGQVARFSRRAALTCQFDSESSGSKLPQETSSLLEFFMEMRKISCEDQLDVAWTEVSDQTWDLTSHLLHGFYPMVLSRQVEKRSLKEIKLGQRLILDYRAGQSPSWAVAEYEGRFNSDLAQVKVQQVLGDVQEQLNFMEKPVKVTLLETLQVPFQLLYLVA